MIKNKKINCTLIFYSDTEIISHFSTFNPYTGMIDYVCRGLKPKEIEFHYQNQKFKYNLYTLGGRCFMQDYETSPFNMLFTLDLKLNPKKEQKKIKI